MGRTVRRKFQGRGIPLARANRERLDRATGIQRVPRTAGVRGGLPVLDDGRVLEVANVVWCTGFVPDFGWIDLPVLDQDGAPCTTAASWEPSRACTSWDCCSCTR